MSAKVDTKDMCRILDRNLAWFQNSGVMSPSDGSWGVGERVVLTENNSAISKIYTVFPAYTEYDGYTIMEHRRADCNFQAAYLFYLASQCLDRSSYRDITRNLIHYLFRRSGMQCLRSDDEIPFGIWRWSTPQWTPGYWYDDNAWNAMIPLLLTKACPELEEAYSLRQAGLLIADEFVKVIPHLRDSQWSSFWNGKIHSPHWGALVSMTLGTAYRYTQKNDYATGSIALLDFLEENSASFTTSEEAYMLLGASVAAACTNESRWMDSSRRYADTLLEKCHPDGHLPSQWRETPAGEHLVDLIYTQNWATLGFQVLADVTGEDAYIDFTRRSISLLCDIQDTSAALHLNGCWRGLYDKNANDWGGGDHYEGGAGSIYTGWTNAPISIAIALDILGKSLVTV